MCFERMSRSTNPRQRIPDEHVYHAGAAERGVHEDHPCGLLAHLTYDLGFLATFDSSQRLQGSIGNLGSHDGDELTFVGDVEGVYTQDLARPIDHVPDREPLFPEHDPVPRVTGELVQDRPDSAARGIA